MGLQVEQLLELLPEVVPAVVSAVVLRVFHRTSVVPSTHPCVVSRSFPAAVDRSDLRSSAAGSSESTVASVDTAVLCEGWESMEYRTASR